MHGKPLSLSVVMLIVTLALVGLWCIREVCIDMGWIDEPVRVEYYQEEPTR